MSVFHISDALPAYYELLATMRVDKPTGGSKANTYLIFDYQGKEDFKFAGINVSTNKLQMGHRNASGWNVDEQDNIQAKPDRDYNMRLAINGVTATLVVDNDDVFSHVYDPRIIEGVSVGLNTGLVGIGANNSKGQIDNMTVQVLPPDFTIEQDEDLTNDVSAFSPTSGTWTADASGYTGTVAGADPAMALVDLGLPGSNTGIALEMEATFNTTTPKRM